MTVTTIKSEIPRDRWSRPLVIPPGGGRPVAYTRATTYIDVLEDKYNLQRWMQRMVALGLASRPDLLLSVSAHREDKRQLDRICDDAREAAAASAKATTGTALHALTELIDRGQPLPEGLPANVLASLDAYKAATADLKPVHIERFCVQDKLKVGGTPDRILRLGRKRQLYIGDIKTGSIEWGVLKIAMQLALYSRSRLYDIATGERTYHEADTTRGLIIHLPAVDDPADARCDLHWINLEEGWNAVLVARDVREKRALKFRDLTEPYATEVATPAAPVEPAAPSLEDQIKACTTADDVRALWTPDWTPELIDLAKAHINSLPSVS